MLKAGSASGRHRLVGSSAAPISVHRESLHRRLLVGSGTEPFLLGLVRENEGVAARILLDFDADSEKVRNEVIGLLNKPGERRFAPTAPRTPSSTWLEAAGLPNGLLDGAGAPLRALTAEIEDNLERRADAGDLIGLLACISRDSPPAHSPLWASMPTSLPTPSIAPERTTRARASWPRSS